MTLPLNLATVEPRSRPVYLTPAQFADFAVKALVDEAELTPKPGLVDRRGSGAHRDLDLAALLRSAESLRATFATMAKISLGRVSDRCSARAAGGRRSAWRTRDDGRHGRLQ